MMDAKRLKALVALSGMRFQADQAKLAQLQAKERALRQNLQDLVQQRRARSLSATDTVDPATIAGADVQWHSWVDQRRKTINAELAQLLAQIADSQARLRKSFGQDQAAQQLLAKVQAAQRGPEW